VREDQIILKKKKLEEERREKKTSQIFSLQNKVVKDKGVRLEPHVSSNVVPQTFLENQKKIKTLMVEQPLFLLHGNKTLTATSYELESLPNGVKNLLKEFDDLFPKEVPHGLPPLRRIECQIDLIPRANLPNGQAYRMNPEETKEI